MTYSSEVLADSPLAYYRMGEASGTTLVDSSGNGRGGTYTASGVTLGSTGCIADTDTCATLNGSTGYATVPYASWMNTPTTGFTAELWFSMAGSIAGGYLGGRRAGGADQWCLIAGGDNNIAVILNTSAGQFVLTTPYTRTIGVVYHVVTTYDGSTLRLYVNGSLASSTAASGTVSTPGSDLYLGRIQGDLSNFFPGRIDELAVYATALSSTRIAAHYSAGTSSGPATTTGTGTATAPVPSAAGTGTSTTTGTGTATAPTPGATGTGTSTTTATGSGSATAPTPTASGTGTSPGGTVTGSGSATAPTPTATGTGSADTEPGATIFDEITLEDLLFVELTPAADLDIAIPILSEKKPSPVLTPANPTHQAWVDYTPTTDVVGFAHIWVDGVDITYFRGKPTIVRNWTKEAPFGDKAAMWEMPQLDPWDEVGQGDLSFIRKGAKVVIGIVDDVTGAVDRKWSGFYHSRTKGFDSGESFVFEAHGTMWAAMFQAIEPTPYQPPVDIGVLIPRILNGLIGKPFHDVPQTLTGLPTRYRGARDEKAWQAVQNILARDGWTADGRQWTLRQVADDEFRLVLKSPMSHIDGTVSWGNPDVDFDLTVDEDSRVDGVFCRWVTKGGGESANVYYPGLELLDGLPYPNASAGDFINLGDTDAGTTSGTGVSDLQRKLIAEGYADGLTVTGVQSSAWVDVVREAQYALHITVDGSVGPQTWTRLFTVVDESIDLTPRRLPMAVKDNAWPTIDGANGQILGVNPAFDGMPPNYVYLDMGTNLTKTEVRGLARTYLAVNGEAVVTGSAQFRGCLDDLARTDVDLGQNIKVRGWDGADVVLQVGRVSVDLDNDTAAYVVQVDADERARDALSIDQILDRNREALPDPARRPGTPNRSTRLVSDEGFSWDADSRCGKLVRTPLNGSTGLWVRKVIPFAEVGQLSGIRLHSTVPFAMVLMASLRYTENMMRADVGDPFASSDPYRPHMDTLEKYGFLAAWGAQGDACGYSPGQESDGYAFTGLFSEQTTLEYVTETGPYVAAFFFARDADGFVWGFEDGDGFLPARQT